MHIYIGISTQWNEYNRTIRNDEIFVYSKLNGTGEHLKWNKLAGWSHSSVVHRQSRGLDNTERWQSICLGL